MIREHQAGDIGWVISQHGKIYSKEFKFTPPFELDIAKKAISLLENKDKFTRLWLKEIQGKNAGSIAISMLQQGTAFINFLLVLDKFRGNNIAQELMNQAIQHAKTHGCQKIRLETYSCLTSARLLYKKLGFQLCESHNNIQKYGQTFEQEFWELTLNEQ